MASPGTVIRRYRLPHLVLLLLLVAGIAWYLLPRFRYRAIVLHHSASDVDNYESIRRYHTEQRHLRDAAYHLILSNGRTEVPLGYLEATSRHRYLSYALATRSWDCNLRAIHLCVVGNWEKDELPEKLRPALAHALKLLMDRVGVGEEAILFHREDCGRTKCPGKHVTKSAVREWVRALSDQCPPEIRAQHEQVLAETSFSIHTAPCPVLLCLGVAWLAVSASWVGLHRFRGNRLAEGGPGKPTVTQRDGVAGASCK